MPVKTLETQSDVGNYNIGQTLGNGASCKVKKGCSPNDTNTPIAVKLLKEKMDDGADTWELC